MSNTLSEKIKEEIGKLPDTPGVYFFLGKKKEILYIGKATSLRSRVKSYFSSDISEKRGPLIEKMMSENLSIKFQKTDSVLEALLSEAELIKKHNPPYNVKGKDQRSWNYIVITDESFPKILIKRERELPEGTKTFFGPFPNSTELKVALKIIRKIFPFRDKCELNQKRPCFNHQIGLCPGTCIGVISEKDYGKTIKHIKLFFQGKKKDLIKNLEKEMKSFAKKREFEEATQIKKKIFALNHINDVALIGSPRGDASGNFRIEAYDISHISGTNMVGVMTVMEYGAPKKQDYRKFNIKGQQGSDDVKALREVLRRRFNHSEWPAPDLIVIDGGTGQINGVRLEIENSKLKIPVVGVVKDERHKPKDITGNESARTLALQHEKEVLIANSESHRYALAFHRNKRKLNMN